MKSMKKSGNKNKSKIKSSCEVSCIAKEIISKYPNVGKQYIIPLLQEIQETDGYISEESIDLIAKKLNVSPGRVYAVATFYSFFRLQPVGKHLLRPCCGTACYVKGSKNIVNKIRDDLGIREDTDTSMDNKFTVSPVACLGACGIAPVMMVGENIYGSLDEEKVEGLLNNLKK